MTLPERTLDLLAAIDPDRASAVVRLVAVTPGRYLLTVVAGTLIESPLASPPSFGPAEAREEHVDQTEIPVPSVNCFMQK